MIKSTKPIPGPLGPEHAADEEPGTPTTSQAEGLPPAPLKIVLAVGQAVHVVGHDGTPLLRVCMKDGEPRIELCANQVELQSKMLRISADAVEVRSRQVSAEGVVYDPDTLN